MNLGMTFIDLRLEEMGMAVVDTLLWRIQNPGAAYRRVLIQPKVIAQEEVRL
jgi:DNA-binding LacI/PurR family transcriptional regulator